MGTALTPVQKVTALRIQRAAAKPGAIGMKGFLLWTEAAWPPAVAKKILEAAGKYTPGASTSSATAPTLASPAAQGFGSFGDATDLSFTPDVSYMAPVASTTAVSDATQAPVSGVTAATPSQPASSSWMSDIGNAVTAATTAYLGATQVKDAQTIFNTNLQRAQQGLPMIPTNPTQYGLPSPTANIGLTSSTQNALLMAAGGIALVVLLSSILGRKRA